jgi:hypothetical protein
MKYIQQSTPKIMDNIDTELIGVIENKIFENIPLSKEENDYLLSYVCFETRTRFTDDIEDYSFEYKCDKAQSIICTYLNDLDVSNNPNMTQNSITNDIVGHSFVVASFNVEGNMIPYIIDPTYRQFFLKDKCDESNYIIFSNKLIIKTPDPGFFIKDEDRNKIHHLLEFGYDTLNDELARIYGDSFYNTKTGSSVEDKDKFKTIPGKIYINSFLKGNERLSTPRNELESLGFSLERQSQKKM